MHSTRRKQKQGLFTNKNMEYPQISKLVTLSYRAQSRDL
jgi:hypothetical protein